MHAVTALAEGGSGGQGTWTRKCRARSAAARSGSTRSLCREGAPSESWREQGAGGREQAGSRGGAGRSVARREAGTGHVHAEYRILRGERIAVGSPLQLPTLTRCRRCHGGRWQVVVCAYRSQIGVLSLPASGLPKRFPMSVAPALALLAASLQYGSGLHVQSDCPAPASASQRCSSPARVRDGRVCGSGGVTHLYRVVVVRQTSVGTVV